MPWSPQCQEAHGTLAPGSRGAPTVCLPSDAPLPPLYSSSRCQRHFSPACSSDVLVDPCWESAVEGPKMWLLPHEDSCPTLLFLYFRPPGLLTFLDHIQFPLATMVCCYLLGIWYFLDFGPSFTFPKVCPNRSFSLPTFVETVAFL